MYYDDHHDYHDQIRQYGSKLRNKNSVPTSVSPAPGPFIDLFKYPLSPVADRK